MSLDPYQKRESTELRDATVENLGAVRKDFGAALDRIPEEDRASLSKFFDHIVRGHIGFSLFGDKPISRMACYRYADPILESGVGYLEKYTDLFQSQKFKFFVLRDEFGTELSLVNSQAALQSIERSGAVFSEILGESVTVGEIYSDLLRSASPWKIARSSTALEGILMGYGELNALGYARFSWLREGGLESPVIRREADLFGRRIGINFGSSAAELDYLIENLKVWSQGEWYTLNQEDRLMELALRGSSTISLPTFFGFPAAPDTDRIITRFLAEKRRIETVLASEQTLALALSQFGE